MSKDLKIYQTSHVTPRIVPAPMSLPWMNSTTKGFANRCLPLRMGCAQGWHALNHATFIAAWNGGDRPEDIAVVGQDSDVKHFVNSHFGYGVLTFSNHFLIRTPETHDLYVCGPANEPYDGIRPLSAVIETSWSYMSFTMNWKFTRPGTFFMEEGQPYMQFWPTPRRELEEFVPTLEPFESCPFKEDYLEWSAKRDGFHALVRNGDFDAVKAGWQGDYLRGADRKVSKLKGVNEMRGPEFGFAPVPDEGLIMRVEREGKDDVE